MESDVASSPEAAMEHLDRMIRGCAYFDVSYMRSPIGRKVTELLRFIGKELEDIRTGLKSEETNENE